MGRLVTAQRHQRPQGGLGGPGARSHHPWVTSVPSIKISLMHVPRISLPHSLSSTLGDAWDSGNSPACVSVLSHRTCSGVQIFEPSTVHETLRSLFYLQKRNPYIGLIIEVIKILYDSSHQVRGVLTSPQVSLAGAISVQTFYTLSSLQS